MGINIAVVGGGYSGVELALNIMERLKKKKGTKYSEVNLTLIHRGEEVLQYATEYNQKIGLERLVKAGVNIMTKTSVLEVVPSSVPQSEQDDKKKFNYLEKNKCQVVLQGSETATTAEDEEENDKTLL